MEYNRQRAENIGNCMLIRLPDGRHQHIHVDLAGPLMHVGLQVITGYHKSTKTNQSVVSFGLEWTP